MQIVETNVKQSCNFANMHFFACVFAFLTEKQKKYKKKEEKQKII